MDLVVLSAILVLLVMAILFKNPVDDPNQMVF
jgi:hypothetical protein